MFDIITETNTKGRDAKSFPQKIGCRRGSTPRQASAPEKYNQHKTRGLRSKEDQKPALLKMVHVLKYNMLLCPSGHGILILLAATTMYVSEWQ